MLVVLLLFASLSGVRSTNNEIETISSGGGRWVFPADCTNNCRSIHWNPLISGVKMMMQFTIEGPSNGYVGIAISVDRQMGDDNVYLCSRADSQSSQVLVNTGYLARYQAPEVVPLDPDDVILTSIADTIMTCKFNRPMNVTKIVSGDLVSWDLGSDDFNILYAEGDVNNDGEIQHHTFKYRTQIPIRLTNNTGYRQMSSIPPGLSGVLVPFVQSRNIAALPNGGGVWVFSDTCEGKCKSVAWEPVVVDGEEMVNFTITAADRGFGGFMMIHDSPSNNGDCYICLRLSPYSSDVIVLSAVCDGLNAPKIDSLVPPDKVLYTDVTDGFMTCSFLRPISVSKTIDGVSTAYDVTMTSYVMYYAEGSISNAGIVNSPDFVAVTPTPHILIDIEAFRDQL